MGKAFKARFPFLSCPKPDCGSDRFGVLAVYDDHYMRRCNTCDHDQSFPLPTLRKKIVYLDQTAISHMVKARLGRGEVKKWTVLEQALKRAIGRQAICCPHSDAHEMESLMDIKLRNEYKKLYQDLSINNRLLSPHQIDMNHTAMALDIFDGSHAQSRWPRWHMILDKDPNVWTPDMYVSVNLGGREEQEARFRQVKCDVNKELAGVNDFVRMSPKTFEEHFDSETKQNAVNVIEIFRRNLLSIAKAATPEEKGQAFLQGSIYGDTMYYILRRCDRANPYSEEAIALATRFLSSPAFAGMPHVRISSAIFAEISMRTKRGSKGFQASDLTDVEVISHYAPYCDAMFIDNEMWSILSSNPVKKKIGIGTRFFSSSVFEDFAAFIEDCIRQVPREIAEKVIEVYGIE